MMGEYVHACPTVRSHRPQLQGPAMIEAEPVVGGPWLNGVHLLLLGVDRGVAQSQFGGGELG